MNNTSFESNTTNTSDYTSLFYKISLLCVLSSIVLTTLIGNFLVIAAILTTKSLKTVTNSFILSLAVADTLVAIFVLPLSIYMVIYNDWIFGKFLCDLWISCDVGLCTASILNLCCISLDRYFAITRPLKYSRQRSPKLAKIMIAVVWVGSFLITCPPIFGWKDTNRKENTCQLNLLLSYRIYSSLGSFYLPCFIMIFVYIRIFKVIHDREKYLSVNSTTFSFFNKEKKRKKPAEKLPSFSTYISESEPSDEKKSPQINDKRVFFCVRKSKQNGELDKKIRDKLKNSDVTLNLKGSLTRITNANKQVGEKLAETTLSNKKSNLNSSFNTQDNLKRIKSGTQEQMRLIKESKAAKTLAIVVGGFILSWLPFFIMYVLEAVLTPGTITKAISDWITWLGYVNSAINPFIYAFCSNQFRSAFYRISFGSLKSTSHASSIKYPNNLYFLANNIYMNKMNQSSNGNNNNFSTNFTAISNHRNNKNRIVRNSENF